MLLGQAQRVVELPARLAGHQGAQELHVGRRDLHLDHEVGAREGEQQQQVVLAEQHRVDPQLAAAVVQDRQREGRLAEAVDDLADRVGALVAEEQAGEHLDLEIGEQLGVAELLAQRLADVVDVVPQVLERARELEVRHDAQHRLAQAFRGAGPVGVVGAVGRRGGRLVVLDVLGADRRPHEDEVVAEVAAVQDARGDRVEEGLGQLGLVVLDQQPDVVQLHLLPGLLAQPGGLELALQALHALLDPLVVELDALALCALLAGPVRRLEALLGRPADLAEQRVVAVEAVEHRARDVVGAPVAERRRAAALGMGDRLPGLGDGHARLLRGRLGGGPAARELGGRHQASVVADA